MFYCKKFTNGIWLLFLAVFFRDREHNAVIASLFWPKLNKLKKSYTTRGVQPAPIKCVCALFYAVHVVWCCSYRLFQNFLVCYLYSFYIWCLWSYHISCHLSCCAHALVVRAFFSLLPVPKLAYVACNLTWIPWLLRQKFTLLRRF